MSEKTDAQDFVLDAYNIIKKLNELDWDPSVFEPVRVEAGKMISEIDGREMTEKEFLTVHPRGTFK